MSNTEVINTQKEYKTTKSTKVHEHPNKLLDHQKRDENLEKIQKPCKILQTEEPAAVVDREENFQELALKNGNTIADSNSPSPKVMPNDDSYEKDARKQGVPEKCDDKKTGTDKCNLIINYLPETFNENDVMRYFSHFGLVQQCKVVRNLRTRKSKGYGFVKYAEQKSAEAAMKELNGFSVENKTLKVAVARKHCKEIRNANLYVTHIPKTMDSEGLMKLFKPYGRLVECRVLKDKQGRYRGVGFVRFDMHEQAMQALQALNKKKPNGWQKALRVNLAVKRPRYPMDRWNSHKRRSEISDWWCGVYPPSPSPMVFSPLSPSQRSTHPAFFDCHTPHRRCDGCHSEWPQPYGYQPHQVYSYPPYYTGSGWAHSRPIPMSDHFGHHPSLDHRRGHTVRSPLNQYTVVVTNLADNVNEVDLVDIFSKFTGEKCRVFKTSGANPHAFIDFHRCKSALDACKLNGRVVRGRAMRIFLKN